MRRLLKKRIALRVATGQYVLAVELSEVQRSKSFKLQIFQVQRASPFPVTPNCDGGLQWGNAAWEFYSLSIIESMIRVDSIRLPAQPDPEDARVVLRKAYD